MFESKGINNQTTLLFKKFSVKALDMMYTFMYFFMIGRYNMAYGVFDLVVEVGSSLGLWVGLSVLGIFDLVLAAKKCRVL